MNINKLLPGVKKNVSLAEQTTFKIGGRAKYFFSARMERDLIKAVTAAKKLKLPFFILGGGSNLLASDKGFKGLVIKMQNTKYQILNTKIIVGAGVLLNKLVSLSVEKSLTDLEWAAGIPGTIGGAIRGNAGAFGKSMKDIVGTVTVLETKNKEPKIKILKNAQCGFAYRDSIFKKKKNLIILSAELQLEKGKKKEIENKIKKYSEYKKKNHPWNYPSAGSVFKNPSGFSAGELISKCGLKDKKAGKAKISEKHANFIVNLGGASSTDVKKLINLAKKSVKNKFKIDLEEEIKFL
ncbi:MAG TPA: UDP-N-acetylmuramate dehydrogenase [Patescibacteria group bacterium]|nr:UDP-N-acetylmuramate dehydrogenase [Patescibacteria group bacterium]